MEKRERPDNLELLDPLEEEEDLETMDLKETLYDIHSQHTADFLSPLSLSCLKFKFKCILCASLI